MQIEIIDDSCDSDPVTEHLLLKLNKFQIINAAGQPSLIASQERLEAPHVFVPVLPIPVHGRQPQDNGR